jgi:hypothetical protein
MTSTRKISANRANSRASTGPKTAAARARAARNALRHGLTLPIHFNASFSEQVEALARKIAGADAKPEFLGQARQVAEAQTDLLRVRHARYRLMSDALQVPHDESRPKPREKTARLSVSGTNPPDFSMPGATKYLRAVPEEPDKIAAALSQESKRLLALDRYEQRATSRRRIAIRAFDELRQREQLVAQFRKEDADEGSAQFYL